MLSDSDLIRVQEVSSSLTRPVKLLVFGTGSQSLFERELFDIARQVSGVSMNRIILEETSEPVVVGKPSITVTSDETRRINYLTLPQGPELGPFLEAISWLGSDVDYPKSLLGEALSLLDVPLEILVLMAAPCPHCPQTVRAALQQARWSDKTSVIIADALEFQDLADEFRCKSTPMIIVNGELTIIGNITEEDLAKKLIECCDERSLTVIIESMIKSGRAEDAAKLVCKKNVPQYLVEILKQKEFSARIGALVAIESCLEANPRIFDSVIDNLCELLSAEDVALKGDTAELLGKIGNVRAIPFLEKALTDEDEDVREAASEALEALRARSNDE